MSPRAQRWVGAAALVAVLGSFGAARWAYRVRWDAERDAAAAQRQAAELRAQIDKAPAIAAVSSPVKSPAEPTPPPAPAPAAAQKPSMQKIVASNPELLAMYERAHRLALPQKYGAFYRQRQLTAEQIQKLEELLSRDGEDEVDLYMTAEKLGLKRGDPALTQLRAQQKVDMRTAQENLLGADGVAALEKYNQTFSVSSDVRELASLTAFTATPLNESQLTRLREIFATTKVTSREASPTVREGSAMAEVLAQAATVLDEAQMQRLRAQMEGQRMTDRLAQFYIQRGYKY